METIKNYLESMFASYPATQEVLRAKRELYQMMEDKYNELISEGKNDNEAVGIVISEFGNLEEISGALGIDTKTEEFTPVERRMITKDEAREYMKDRRTHAITLGIGIFFLITSVAWSGIISNDYIGAAALLTSVIIGVLCIVFGNLPMGKWSFVKEELCGLDYAAETFTKDARESYRSLHAILLCVGIIICALCWLPSAVISNFAITRFFDEGLFFFVVATGVFLIVETSTEQNTYERLLCLNGLTKETYKKADRDIPNYQSKTIDIIMHVFWPTITCIYLCVSFLTFLWGITWIIWPIAAVIFGVLKTVFRDNEQ